MKVKIGNIYFDPKDEPVMIILDEKDKKLISNMAEDNTKYCCFPDNMEPEEIKKWMNE